ncbi:hypothetical protein D3C85_372920 [compost metagenome]
MDKAEIRKAILNDMARPLAETIQAIAKLHEESYDHAAAEKATQAEALCSMDQFYGITIQEAADQLCEPLMAAVLGRMLKQSWNESLDWAKEVLL